LKDITCGKDGLYRFQFHKSKEQCATRQKSQRTLKTFERFDFEWNWVWLGLIRRNLKQCTFILSRT